jgi:hypothetical protein
VPSGPSRQSNGPPNHRRRNIILIAVGAMAIVGVVLVIVFRPPSPTSTASYKAGYQEGKQLLAKKSLSLSDGIVGYVFGGHVIPTYTTEKFPDNYKGYFEANCVWDFYNYYNAGDDNWEAHPGWSESIFFQGCMAPYYAFEKS